MAFPSNPAVGKRYTNARGVTYEYIEKGAWIIVATNNGLIKYTVSPTAPVTPDLGDQWWDTIAEVLKTYSTDGENFTWTTIGGKIGVPIVSDTEPADPYEGLQWYYDGELYVYIAINGVLQWVPVSSSTDVSRVVPLQWYYGDEKFDFELFNSNPLYTWRNYVDTKVTSLESGDDTLKVTSTANLQPDDNYVLVNAEGISLATITILSVLTDHTIRAKETLNFNITEEENVILSKTSFNVQARGSAVVQDKDVLFSRPLLALRERKGFVFIRRQASGTGSFSVSYRERGALTWVTAPFMGSIPVDGNSLLRDDKFNVDFVGILEFRVTFNKDEAAEEEYSEIIEHLALITAKQSFENQRIFKPHNVTPASEAVGVLATPTLVLSAYKSLYNISQNGAEFQVATDANFNNLKFSTSSDFLAGWIARADESANFTDAIFYADNKAIAIGTAGEIRKTAGGGKTFTAGSTAVSTQLNGIAYNGSGRIFIVGHTGVARYSDNEGVALSTITLPDSFTGNLYGVAAQGSVSIIVGATGRIYRSTNNGTILAVVPPAAAYTGVFRSVALAPNGFGVAVGDNGEIQTTSDFGSNWVRRNPPGGYTGTYNKVVMTDDGTAIAVGTLGAVHKSIDYGGTWAAKTAADSYTGTINNVRISGEYVAIVGANGMVQSSSNKGDTFYTRQLAGSISTAINAVALQADLNNAFVAGAGGVVQTALKLEGSVNSFTIPAGSDLLEIDNVYWWKGRYKDVVDIWSEWSDATAFSTASDFKYVRQPVNLSPASGATNIPTSGTPLSLSRFIAVNDDDDQLANVRYEVYSDAAMTTLVYGVTVTHTPSPTSEPTSVVIPDGYLTNGMTYYWRANQTGTSGRISPWSLRTAFSVRAVPSQPSVVSPTNNATVNVIPTFVGSTFVGVNGAHNATEIHISSSAAFTDKVYGVVKTTAPLTTIVIPSGFLAYSRTYYARIRYRDVLGLWSNWSVTRSFITLAQPNINSLFDARRNKYLDNRHGQTVNLGVDMQSGSMFWSKLIRTNFIGMGSLQPRSFMLDTVRGAANAIYSTHSIAQTAFGSSGGFSFTSNGWQKFAQPSAFPYAEGGYAEEVDTPGTDALSTFQSWAFKRAPLFFDIISWTGNGVSAGQVVNHNLKCAPGFLMAKAYTFNDNWYVSHCYDWTRTYRALSTASWSSNLISAATDTSFTVRGSMNTAGRPYIGYVWANDQTPNSVVKCGTYQGNGATGRSVLFGFQPQFMMVKRWDGVTPWWVRSYPYEENLVWNDPNGNNSYQFSLGTRDIGTVVSGGGNTQLTLRPLTGGLWAVKNTNEDSFDLNVFNQTYIYMAIRKF